MQILLPCVCWTLLPLLAAAEPRIERDDLFEAGTNGYAIYRIPGLVVTAQGSVLAYCEARRSGGSDWGEIDLLLCRSTDGGRTWSPPQKVSEAPGPKSKNPAVLARGRVNPDHVTYNNPVAIADRDGSVHWLFCLEYARCFYQRSDDDGVSWSEPREITGECFDHFRPDYDWQVLATGPGHGIELSSGRLLVPVWLSLGTEGNAHRPSVTSVIYSDDHGRTWQAGEIAVPNTADWVNPSEAAVAELSDGKVLLNARTETKANRRVITISENGIGGWSQPRHDDALFEPICMASMTTLHDDGQVLLFANPHNLDRAGGIASPGQSRDRKNLTVQLSTDDGASWPVRKTLEPGSSAYSDLAVLPDGTILCLYERGAREGEAAKPKAYACLTVARFNRQWLLYDSAADKP